MKKTIIFLSLVLVSLKVNAKEFSKEKLYFGSYFGYSEYHNADFYGNGFTSIGRKPIQNFQLGSGMFLGFQEKSFLSFEMGYNFPEYLKYSDNHYDYATFKSQGGSISAKMNFPIFNKKIDTYIKVGSMIWKIDSKGSDQYGNLKSFDGKEHDFGISPLLCLGLEKKLNNNWSTRLEYQWINKIGNKNSVGSCPNNSVINVGVSYSFERKNNFPFEHQTHIFHTKKKENASNKDIQLILKSCILFDFNKSILRTSEKKSLDQLYSQIMYSSIDLKKNLIFIMGYTDNIGSKKYNYKLSQDRAKNVANYLFSKGGLLKKYIIYRGMGKCSVSNYEASLCRCVKIYIQK